MKADAKTLLNEIADDFNTYLRKGANFDSFSEKVDPNLNIDNLEKLLRIHFLLTKSEDGNTGVIDFVEDLEERIRNIKTSVTTKTQVSRNRIRGRVDWSRTFEERTRRGNNPTVFASSSSQKKYSIKENLVLKQLLNVITDILGNDLSDVWDKTGYGWLDDWVDSDKELKQKVEKVFNRNVYLQKIELEEKVTDRMIEDVKKSRKQLYQEAAELLSRYRSLLNYELDEEDAKKLLENTFIKPEKTYVLFELYWIFKMLPEKKVNFKILDTDNPSLVARWVEGYSEFEIYHDTTASFVFKEDLKDAEMEDLEDGFLYRQGKVLEKWNELSTEAFDKDVKKELWGGRPDIVRIKRGLDGGEIKEIMLGEVKYTENTRYALQGLKELLEYMAFVKEGKEYISDKEHVLKDSKVKGELLLDDVDVNQENGNVRIRSFSLEQ